MTAKKALIIEDAYLHAEDAPGLDDAIVYVSENTVDITTHHGNALCLDFDDLAAIQDMVDEARKPKTRGALSVHIDPGTIAELSAGFDRALQGAVNTVAEKQKKGWPPDWSRIPAEYNFAAVDKDGTTCAYQAKPRRGCRIWFPNEKPCLSFGSVILPANVSWRDSLCERPADSVAPDELAFLGITWADVPEGWNYVAADKDGTIWAYAGPPKRCLGDYWYAGSGNRNLSRVALPTPGDWKKSLRIRPSHMEFVLDVTWADVREGYDFVAADKNGDVYAYADGRPSISDDRWCSGAMATKPTYQLCTTRLPRDLDWRNTLFVRPGYTA